MVRASVRSMTDLRQKAAWVPIVSQPSHRLVRVSESLTSSTDTYTVVPRAYTIQHPRLQRLLHLLPAIDMRGIEVSICQELGTVIIPWKYRALPGYMRQVLVDMAMAHARITQSAMVLGRVAVVYGTPCPRWHVDKVDMRGLCTLHGPGSVLLEAGTETHLDAGDVVFMRGAGEEGTQAHSAIVHRSPIIPEDVREPRIIVQTDSLT